MTRTAEHAPICFAVSAVAPHDSAESSANGSVQDATPTVLSTQVQLVPCYVRYAVGLRFVGATSAAPNGVS